MFEVAVFSVMVVVPALAACVIAPVSEILPLAVSAKVPDPTPEVPKARAAPLVKATALAPELFKETDPIKLLPELARVRTPLLPVKLAAPAVAACVIAVLTACVIPIPFAVSVPEPTPTLPKIKAPLLKRETLLAPLLERVTAPVKLLELPL